MCLPALQFLLSSLNVEYSESSVYPGKDTIKGSLVINIIVIAVTAVYTNGSTEDVTSSAVFNPANGTVITKDTATGGQEARKAEMLGYPSFTYHFSTSQLKLL